MKKKLLIFVVAYNAEKTIQSVISRIPKKNLLNKYNLEILIIDDASKDKTFQISKEIQILQDYYSYTPDVFTPNNDGINDTFSPSLLNVDMNTYNLLVYDRWGNQVFETNDYEEGWDGKLKNGSLLPPDIYSYQIIYNTNLGEEKKETGRIIMAR